MYLEGDERLVMIRPSERQIAHQQLEFYGFIHYTVNTFTGKEWGDGTESPSLFCPAVLDAEQWVLTAKSGGMKGLILTCKHHDGFCLWPSQTTNHTIANSPYKGGEGDLVREVAESCSRHGMRFGVYISPWDRNHETYGQGKPYNDIFVNQLSELLTQYGEIFSVWFDGACGEGSNGRKQIYDWERYYDVIRKLQPNACISVCGPDVRWCGNEAGDTRSSEWSVVAKRMSMAETVEGKSQNSDDSEFRNRKIRSEDLDLGSRMVLQEEKELIWYPAEVNTSIRPGWFYHENEDDHVRTFEDLKSIYLNSVGGNATFLLNLPPTKEGIVHSRDAASLHRLGEFITKTFSNNIARSATFYADSWENGYPIDHVRDQNDEKFFKTEDKVTEVSITISWEQPQTISYIVLQENIRMSQRIESFTISNANESLIYSGTTVGYKRIVLFNEAITTKSIVIKITDSRVCPTLNFIGAY